MAVVRPWRVRFGTSNGRRRGHPSKRNSSSSYRIQSDTGFLTARTTSTGVERGDPVCGLGPIVTEHVALLGCQVT